MRYELDLIPDLDGEVKTVILDTSISLYFLRKMQMEGWVSKTFIGNLALAESDPSKAGFDDMLNAPYIAYRNANPNGMTKDDFESKIKLDMDMCGALYAEIIAGNSAKNNTMANSFRKVTTRKK